MDNIKKFEDFLDRMQGLLDNAKKQGNIIVRVEDLENTFPELKEKESEDEKIRKELLESFKYQQRESRTDKEWLNGIKLSEVVAWLEKQGKEDYNPYKVVIESIAEMCERYSHTMDWKDFYDNVKVKCKDAIEYDKANSEKQGEQKQDPCEHCKDKCLNCHNFPCIEKRAFEQGKTALEAVREDKADNQNCAADNIESKFKAGDWIISNDKKSTYQVKEVKRGIYIIRDVEDNKKYHIGIKECERYGRLWELSDAKAGDVLSCKSLGITFIMILKCINQNRSLDSYCRYNTIDGFGIDVPKVMSINDNPKPATKEQHDLLFQKMKEAGYEWNAEKKELKKIESKSAWSEEDALRLEEVICMIEANGRWVRSDDAAKLDSDWLKSLKDRVQPQSHWKPSEEQIEAFEHFVRSIGESGYASPYDTNTKLLYSLLEQIKNLK